MLNELLKEIIIEIIEYIPPHKSDNGMKVLEIPCHICMVYNQWH